MEFKRTATNASADLIQKPTEKCPFLSKGDRGEWFCPNTEKYDGQGQRISKTKTIEVQELYWAQTLWFSAVVSINMLWGRTA